ncbi:MAG: hypothetical protein V1874_00735 [Spirochaetota bacterium]
MKDCFKFLRVLIIFLIMLGMVSCGGGGGSSSPGITGDPPTSPGSLDTSFNPGAGPNSQGKIYCMAIQSDGKIIIGGEFNYYSSYSRNNIARINSDGSLDTTFDPGTGADDVVRSLAIQSDGQIVTGGRFITYNGSSRSHIARLNTDGSLDSSFDPGTGTDTYSSIYSIAIQSDGKIIIGGAFTTYNSSSRSCIARINSNGSLDTSFDPGTGTGTNYAVKSIAIQSDGKIVIGGDFITYNGTSRHYIARINSDGSLDTSFDPGTGVGWGIVLCVAIQSDSKIIIGGTFETYNGSSRDTIARINSDGSLDISFAPSIGAGYYLNGIAIQNDGKIVICEQYSSNIIRINTDGSTDSLFNLNKPSFYESMDSGFYCLGIQSNGKIVIGGFLENDYGTAIKSIIRLESTGSQDNSFAATIPLQNEVLSLACMAIQSDGKIIVGGEFSGYSGIAKNNLARINTDGSLDSSFDTGTGANYSVNSIAIQSDGKIIIGGYFTAYNSTVRNRIARINTDGSLDTSFDPGTGATNYLNSIAIQSDGKILIGGGFTAYNSTVRNRIARINTNGSIDSSFNPGTGANSSVSSIAIQSDGKILIGGGFTSYNSTVRNHIARINTDGSLDSSFDPDTGANSSVSSIAIQSDGKILIGGGFTTYNSTVRNHITRINSDGSLDTTFNPGTGAGDNVKCMSIQSDGKIVIGGEFTTYNSTVRCRIARINSDGSLNTTFDPGTGADDDIECMSIQSDSKIIVGGEFSSYNGTARNNIARINP